MPVFSFAVVSKELTEFWAIVRLQAGYFERKIFSNFLEKKQTLVSIGFPGEAGIAVPRLDI